MNKISPLSPSAVKKAQAAAFHLDQRMIQTVNELLIKNFDGHHAIILQKEIVDLYCKKANLTRLEDIKQLDFEEPYRQKGWVVEYDKPAYNEDYPAKFIFKLKLYDPTPTEND